jgi:hypothetical protein
MALFETKKPANEYKNMSQRADRTLPRFRATLRDGWRVFYFCCLLGIVELVVLRIAFGAHETGEEIVVLAVPMTIIFLGLRVFRTTIDPLPDQPPETVKSILVSLHEILMLIFGLFLLVLILVLASACVYRYMGIAWAFDAGITFAGGIAILLIILSSAIYFTSNKGRHQLTLAVRALMGWPEMVRRYLEGVPNRIHLRRS